MRMVFIELRHFVISSTARFFSEGTSNLEILSLTERTRSCGVLGRFERLKRNAMVPLDKASAGCGTGLRPHAHSTWDGTGPAETQTVCALSTPSVYLPFWPGFRGLCHLT
jgi:hypothetical protein